MQNYTKDKIETDVSALAFWHAVNILITKPHVVNKRIWGLKVWFHCVCTVFGLRDLNLLRNCDRLQVTATEDSILEYINKTLELFKIKQTDHGETEIFLFELLPKNYDSNNHVYQLVYLNRDTSNVTFYDISPKRSNQNVCPDFTYDLKLENSGIILTTANDSTNSKSYLWLRQVLLPQFVKWTKEVTSPAQNNICNTSLGLVSQEKYYQKYNKLKDKYGREMVKIWPECTDPSKFVYEDVAIATYLILIWEAEQRDLTSKQNFVDLGCGNGLLVHILYQEGYHGVGIDVRRRKIWEMYPNNIQLQEKTIIPSDFTLFPETDWIIGNHSDELTPWIPVIAAKSSYKCNFFLLPCCAYNFDGTKYQRKNSFKSQYLDYLDYIKQLCDECGFKADIDRLKIPSTKRICIVSRGRNYSINEHEVYCNKIQKNIQNVTKTATNKSTTGSTTWVEGFKPRESVDRIRNCTRVDKTVIKSIVNSISKYLLEDYCNGIEWSCGKTVEINELVQLLPPSQLKQLKSECGGLQTLLRNNHQIFEVKSGKVSLRYPKTVKEVSNKSKNKSIDLKLKQKPCWFYNNHPQGCPLNETNCSFLHVQG